VLFRRQEPSHPGFVAVDQRYDCRQCIMTHGQRLEFPPLDDESALAWHLFQTVEGQVRAGMDIIGLDICALPPVFDIYGIPYGERRTLFEKITVIANAQQTERAVAAARKQSMDAAAKTEASFRG
jgi:hypothetical protein